MWEAGSSIQAIIEHVDPVKTTHSHLNAILTVLSIGLSIIPIVGPEAPGLGAVTVGGISGIYQLHERDVWR